MTHEDYQTLVETYGVHPSRWPEDMRSVAMQYAYKHPEQATHINANAAFLDKVMDAAKLPDTDNNLLSARILKAAEATPQHAGQRARQKIVTPANDHPTKFLPDDDERTPMAKWKLLAATLLITMGIGFGVGQTTAASSDYWAAEDLYAYNMGADYATSEWLEAQE